MSEHPPGAGTGVAPPQRGDWAPPFQLDSLEGERVALDDFEGRRVLLWISRGVFCPLCRVELSQLRRNYQEFQARNTELLEIGPSVPESAVRGFRQYLGGRSLEFPYLCDPDFAVHQLYGLRPVSRTQSLKIEARSMLAHVTERPFIAPPAHEVRKLISTPMEQGLFIIDTTGRIQYSHVSSPAGKLPSAIALLQVLDSLVG